MLSKFFLVIAIIVIAILVMGPSAAIAQENQSCEIQLVYRSTDQNQNQLLQQRYEGAQWSEPDLVHSNASGFSYGATVASDIDGNLIVVWVEDSGSSNQLMYRVKSPSGSWLGPSNALTSIKGEKTTPILIRSISGTVYLAWVSDESDSDDVFLSSWSFADGWSEADVLSVDNAFPDIQPTFDYVEDINGRYELLVRWKARSEDGIYVPDQHLIETGLELKQQSISDQCFEPPSDIVLPANVERGFLHFPQLGLENHKRVRTR